MIMPQLEPNIPTKDELHPPLKKKKRFLAILEPILKILAKMVIKNQKGVKGNSRNENAIDDAIDSI